MTAGRSVGFSEGFADIIAQAIEMATAPLHERLCSLELRYAELEKRQPTMPYRGVWRDDTAYQQGDLATYDGSVWHCKSANQGQRPGSAPSFWQLCVKRGRDGRDAR